MKRYKKLFNEKKIDDDKLIDFVVKLIDDGKTKKDMIDSEQISVWAKKYNVKLTNDELHELVNYPEGWFEDAESV